MIKILITSIFFMSLTGCVSFSGMDLEVSEGTEQGVDQGLHTHKMVYGVLERFRFDVKK
jgi:hypothetical protein